MFICSTSTPLYCTGNLCELNFNEFIMKNTCTYSRGHYLAHLAVRGFCSGLCSHCALFIFLASGISAAPAYLFLLYWSLQCTRIQTLQIHQVIVDGQGWWMACVSIGGVWDADIVQTVVLCGILVWSAACLCPPHTVWWLPLIIHIYCSCHVFPFISHFVVL